MTTGLLAIGKVAAELGLSTRTLRYYEEVGLLTPSGRSSGGARRYTEADVERVRQIRSLQTMMGLDLERIRVFLRAQDELERLRAEYRAGPRPERAAEIAAEGVALYEEMAEEVRAKIDALGSYLADLESRADAARRVTGATPAAQRRKA